AEGVVRPEAEERLAPDGGELLPLELHLDVLRGGEVGGVDDLDGPARVVDAVVGALVELYGARAHDDGALDDGEAEFVDGLDAGAVFSRDDVVVDVRDPLLRHARLEAVERVEGVVADGDLAGDGLEVDRDAGLAFEDAAEVGAEGLAVGEDDAAGGRVDGDALLEVE